MKYKNVIQRFWGHWHCERLGRETLMEETSFIWKKLCLSLSSLGPIHFTSSVKNGIPMAFTPHCSIMGAQIDQVRLDK